MEFPLIAKELKSILKARRIKYAELAPRLGMSESGLKKLLNGVDCSLSKLGQVCDELDISMSSLIARRRSSWGRGFPHRAHQRPCAVRLLNAGGEFGEWSRPHNEISVDTLGRR